MPVTREPKNEIATVDRASFPALRDGSDMAEAMLANLAAGERIDESVLTRVKTPTGGNTTWTIQTAGGEEESKDIRGLLVYHCRRGVLWPNREPVAGTMPVIVSHDLANGEQVGPIPADMEQTLAKCKKSDGKYDWPAVYAVYGGPQSTDRRAKEQRVLFILREGDPWPLIVTAQPGSLKTVKPFVIKLDVPHYRAFISLTLEKVTNKAGQPYARIVPKLVSTLSKEDGARVKATYTDPLGKIAATIDLEAGGEGSDE